VQIPVAGVEGNGGGCGGVMKLAVLGPRRLNSNVTPNVFVENSIV